jgi:sulfite exporter TauE/SafE
VSALLPAILVSSLVGSVHCIAMCGPLVGLHGSARTWRLALVHALGRLTTYVALGVLAGIVGRALDLAGRLASVQHVATIVAGVVILAWGVHAIAVALGWRHGARAQGALFRRGLVQLGGKRAVTRAWLIGVLTGLLPCGWLWAFVVSAAGTASPLTGALVMATFWLGTVPAMTGVLALGGPLVDRMRRRLPVITACVLIVLGVATLSTRWRDAGTSGVAHPHCHEGM